MGFSSDEVTVTVRFLIGVKPSRSLVRLIVGESFSGVMDPMVSFSSDGVTVASGFSVVSVEDRPSRSLVGLIVGKSFSSVLVSTVTLFFFSENVIVGESFSADGLIVWEKVFSRVSVDVEAH